MAAARLSLVVEEGATWDPNFALWNTKSVVDGETVFSDPVDLTGWGIRLQWRKSLDATDKIIDLDSEDDDKPDGTITIDQADGSDVPNRINPFVGATVMAALTPDDFTNDGGLLVGVWDMERYLIANPEIVRRLYKGSVRLDREVTA